MSIRAIVWAFEQQLPTNAKFVLVKLADNANDDGVCWPSMQYIADHTGMSRQSVIDNIKVLAERGLIAVEHRYKDGAQLSNLYRLKLSTALAGGVKDVDRGSQTALPGVVKQVDTNPKIESKKEPGSTPTAKPVDNSKMDSNLRRPGETAVDMVDRWKREFAVDTKAKDMVKH